MRVTLRALTDEDVEAHNAGEDEHTVRWLTGGYGTVGSTTAHFHRLAENARAGFGKRGFGVCLDGRLAGYVDCDPEVGDGLEPGDVNISYAVHPWARGRGVAGEAVRLICEYLHAHRIGRRAAIRVVADNHASVRVAEKSGFTYVHDVVSGAEDRHGSTPVTMRLYVRDL
ncbi:GNAT family N-acetyltransferase [Solwaraspora sp. WMMD1047]|uniref:GNAT family N-acetyltransferase n=1 Tax=Solwaraspora sp. WMMD1047 TaxID=3016102 RepID=UPI002417AA72|nr:GNAT family N-acetyltransferase [Solwaraspora sp. WMMD1047]MDG4829621.1 GNAT family N-acetyltransferase [Solwaraspora sp. WMMD1047]